MKYTERQIRDFWAKVDTNGPVPENSPELGPCWEWTAATINGYGTKRVTEDGKHKMQLAHRMAWEILNSDIPDSLLVLHRCDNRKCVRADRHLFLGTHKDNTQDMMNKVRGNVPFLNQEQVARVKALRAEGMEIRAIAQEMGCSTCPIMRALQGRYDVPEIN